MKYTFDFRNVDYKVLSLLTYEPKTRDDDRLLLSILWTKETEAQNIEEFLKELIDGKISNPETVTRLRRKFQEKFVSLRGEKYEERHQMEAAVCQQLTFYDRW
jgi:hypothetical protein